MGYRFKKYLNYVTPDYKIRKAYKGINCKIIVSYMSCLSIIIARDGKKGACEVLVGVQNGCIITRRELDHKTADRSCKQILF